MVNNLGAGGGGMGGGWRCNEYRFLYVLEEVGQHIGWSSGVLEVM